MKKKIIVITLIVLILAGAGVWGFWIWKGKNVNITKVSTEHIENNNEEKKQENNDLTKIDTSDWKMYKNEELGFEFKYPIEFKLILSKDNFVNLQKDCYESKNGDIGLEMKCELESSIGFGIIEDDLNEFVENYNGDFFHGTPLTRIESQSDYILDGLQAKKLIGTNAHGAGGNDFIFLVKDDKNYLVSFNQYSDIHLKILSTFKFIK